MLGLFVYVFLVLVMERWRGLGRENVEKVSGQMINEVVDRCDV